MYPGEVDRLIGTSAKIPMPAKSVARGLPADLLRARPDLARCRARSLAASNSEYWGAEGGSLSTVYLWAEPLPCRQASSRDVLESGSRNYGFWSRLPMAAVLRWSGEEPW